jgi:activator of 2-hydroxyglutaryl-CoA dehydratase
MCKSIFKRCGVFSKTDCQVLLNQGVSKENIAASIFQAVVNQTITSLGFVCFFFCFCFYLLFFVIKACGKPIKGRVVFLGGCLSFLSVLRDFFCETLQLSFIGSYQTLLENNNTTPKPLSQNNVAILPTNSQYFIAIGAALYSSNQKPLPSSFLKFFFFLFLMICFVRIKK